MFDDPGCPKASEKIVETSLGDYRSGRALMQHLGAERLLDPATSGMLLAIRRGLVEEAGATSMGDYVLIDAVVIALRMRCGSNRWSGTWR
jgi:hypothetical protein